MPNLVYETPTPPSQLYSSNAAGMSGGGAAFPGSSLRPRFQQPSQSIVTSTVLPKSRLREQYRPEMDFDRDSSSSSDSTFSSTDLAPIDNNNSPRHKNHYGASGAAAGTDADENRAPNGYNRSLGYGDAGMGLGVNNKQRFLDIQRPPKQQQQQQHQRGGYLATRVDENSDASVHSSIQSSASDSEDDLAARARRHHRQQMPSIAKATNNITSTPHHGPGVSNNNISKSAFDGMARELKKEFDRIMHAGQESNPANNDNSTHPQSKPTPVPNFRTRRNSAIHANLPTKSPSYVHAPRSPMPRGVEPKRLTSAGLEKPTSNSREHERTPTSQRFFGQHIRYPQQSVVSQDKAHTSVRQAPVKETLNHRSPVLYKNEAGSPFHALSPSYGLPPSVRTSNTGPFEASFLPTSRVSSPKRHDTSCRVPDITGLTEGLTSPSRAASGPSSYRTFAMGSGSPVLSSRVSTGARQDDAFSSALQDMRRRLEVLESENARSEAKVLELQDRLAQENAPNGHSSVINISEDANKLAHSLQEEVAMLQSQIEQHNSTLARLQAKPEHGGLFDASAGASPSSQDVFTSLHEALAQLTDQVMHVRRTLEDILETLKPGNSMRTHAGRQMVVEQIYSNRPSKLDQPANMARANGCYTSARPASDDLEPLPLSRPFSPGLARPASAPVSYPRSAAYRILRGDSGPSNTLHGSPPVDAREPLLARAERILSSLPPRHDSHIHRTCEICQRQLDKSCAEPGPNPQRSQQSYDDSHVHRYSRGPETELPMQTIVTRALQDLEEDFGVHRRIYIDLSNEYKRMDPASADVNRRKILASHLAESIDILEMKADEIKRLYDLLHYKSELQSSTQHNTLMQMAKTTRRTFGYP